MRYLGVILLDGITKLSVKPGRTMTILYIDGFAGPGRYSGGEPGSPLIALDVIANHKVRRANTIRFMFIEADRKRYEQLSHEISSLRPNMPQNFRIETKMGQFDETLSEVLDALDEQNRSLSPTFAFIDPFGIAGTPMSLIARIMANSRCEVVVNFAYDTLNRRGQQPQNRDYMNDLFGTEEWQSLPRGSSPQERRQFYHDLYVRQLREVAKARYVLTFECETKATRPSTTGQVPFYL